MQVENQDKVLTGEGKLLNNRRGSVAESEANSVDNAAFQAQKKRKNSVNKDRTDMWWA